MQGPRPMERWKSVKPVREAVPAPHPCVCCVLAASISLRRALLRSECCLSAAQRSGSGTSPGGRCTDRGSNQRVWISVPASSPAGASSAAVLPHSHSATRLCAVRRIRAVRLSRGGARARSTAHRRKTQCDNRRYDGQTHGSQYLRCGSVQAELAASSSAARDSARVSGRGSSIAIASQHPCVARRMGTTVRSSLQAPVVRTHISLCLFALSVKLGILQPRQMPPVSPAMAAATTASSSAMPTRPPPMPVPAPKAIAVASSSTAADASAAASSSSTSPPTTWPAPLALSASALASIMRDAGYDDAAVAASATAAAAQERSTTKYSVQPTRRDHLWSDTSPRAHSWGLEAAVNAANASLPPSVRTPSPVSMLPSSTHALNFDLLMGHATHLFRNTLQLERRLEKMESARTASPAVMSPAGSSSPSHQQSSSALTFIDPFGTRISIPAQPYHLLSSTLARIRSAYIPAHLHQWVRIGLRKLDPSLDVKPIRIDHDDGEDCYREEEASALELEGVEVLEEKHMRLTLASANLVKYEETMDFSALTPGGVPPSPRSASPSVVKVEAGVSATPGVLVAYGELTIVLRNPFAPTALSRASSAPVASSTDTNAAAPSSTSSASVQTFTMHVLGLDLLSSVFQRLLTHAASAYSWSGITSAKLYSARRAFSVPLEHMRSTESEAREVNMQQSVFSAQLAEAQRVLIVEVTEIDAQGNGPRGGASNEKEISLHIRTLNGQEFSLHIRPTSTIFELKQSIQRLGGSLSLPAVQQKLVHRKRELGQDGRTLRECGVREGDGVALLVKVKDTTATTAGGFHMQCGRVGLNPLTSTSLAAVHLLHAVMCWTIPPSSKLKAMSRSLLISLLVHTRSLLHRLHSSLTTEKTLKGHTSRGRTWVEEEAVRREARGGEEVEEVEREVEMIDAEEHAAAAAQREKRSPSKPPNDDVAEIVVIEDQPTSATPTIGVKRSPPVAAPHSSDGALVDLTEPARPHGNHAGTSADVLDIDPPAQRRRLSQSPMQRS
jgi:hypothetical protein